MPLALRTAFAAAVLALAGSGAAAPPGTDTPRELFDLMVDLPGFTAGPPDGSRVVMSGQLALTVTRRYRAGDGDAVLVAEIQASSAMAEVWRERLALSGASRSTVAGVPALVAPLLKGSGARVTVKLGEAPFALFTLEAKGLARERALDLVRRFPLQAMQDRVGTR